MNAAGFKEAVDELKKATAEDKKARHGDKAARLMTIALFESAEEKVLQVRPGQSSARGRGTPSQSPCSTGHRVRKFGTECECECIKVMCPSGHTLKVNRVFRLTVFLG